MRSALLNLGTLLLLGVGVFFLSLFGLQYYNQYQHSLVSPATLIEQALENIASSSTTSTSGGKKIVYGFLPYWTIKTAQIPQELTHVGYFSISVDSKGNFVTRQDGYAEPGWNTYGSSSFERLQDITKAQNQKLEVLITMMDADSISAFLLTNSAQESFQKNLRTFVRSQPVDGINIDVEYAGEVTPELRLAYTNFIIATNTTLETVDPTIHLSIDVFADTAQKKRIWDIPALAPHLDHIVVMTYDFFRSSSPQSGPVAPVFGSEKDRWDTDIVENLKLFIEQAPPEKILLGIPFYGYEWQTVSDAPGAQTYPKSGAIATYKRVEKLIQDQGLKVQWDPDALSPYITYNDGGNIQTIFYENSRSLSYKLDLVNHTKLGGIAIWALGYEGNTKELWEVIGQKL